MFERFFNIEARKAVQELDGLLSAETLNEVRARDFLATTSLWWYEASVCGSWVRTSLLCLAALVRGKTERAVALNSRRMLLEEQLLG